MHNIAHAPARADDVVVAQRSHVHTSTSHRTHPHTLHTHLRVPMTSSWHSRWPPLAYTLQEQSVWSDSSPHPVTSRTKACGQRGGGSGLGVNSCATLRSMRSYALPQPVTLRTKACGRQMGCVGGAQLHCALSHQTPAHCLGRHWGPPPSTPVQLSGQGQRGADFVHTDALLFLMVSLGRRWKRYVQNGLQQRWWWGATGSGLLAAPRCSCAACDATLSHGPCAEITTAAGLQAY